MANKHGESLARYLNNPNVQIFLDLISAAEGTSQHGYNTTFGGGFIQDLSDHPRILKEFTQTDGIKKQSAAAGRYQFIQRTWDGLVEQLGFEDFSPRNQDIGAVKLIQEAGALNDVIKGDFDAAIKKTGTKWASLPSSKYKQNKRSQDWVDNFLAQRTGGDWQPATPTTQVTQPTPAAGPTPVASDAMARRAGRNAEFDSYRSLLSSPRLEQQSPAYYDGNPNIYRAVVRDVLLGRYGNGQERVDNLIKAGLHPEVVRNMVNEQIRLGSPILEKSNEEIASEILTGIWGNGEDRKKALAEAGYDPTEVQTIVNQMMHGQPTNEVKPPRDLPTPESTFKPELTQIHRWRTDPVHKGFFPEFGREPTPDYSRKHLVHD